MRLLDFRIDWGYQYLYSRRHYHPVYIWDGTLECLRGRITETRQLDYPALWYGPGHCAKEKKLEKPEWRSRTKRGISGIRVLAEAGDSTEFILRTASGNFEFTAEQLESEGRVVFPAGPKYLNCHVVATRTGYLWFRPDPKPGQIVFEAEDLELTHHEWARMNLAWLPPGGSLEFKADIPASNADYSETLFHLIAMAAGDYTPDEETQVHDVFPMKLFCDNIEVADFKHYFREHDLLMQLLEDVWQRFRVKPGKHIFRLKNCNTEFNLAISRIILQQSERNHGELSLPPWGLANEKLTGKIFAVRNDRFTIAGPGFSTEIEAVFGWNEFEFAVKKAGTAVFSSGKDSAEVQVLDCPEENIPVKVGYEMTAVPHDDSGLMDWLLDYTQRTRLGNLIVFRSFLYEKNSRKRKDVPGALLRKWGDFCRKHGLYAAALTDFDNGELVAAAGEKFHDCGRHEYPGAVYARDPEEPWSSSDMKEASENFTKYLKKEVDRAHKVSDRAAFGDASGGIRHSFIAGADFVRAETMVPHTQHLLSQARAAAESLGGGEWGVHIATQHPCQLYFKDQHLGQYFLALMQPWMMGADMIYEEDSLFLMWKEERQTWDDALTKGKRGLTRAFFKFAKTHPRRGKCVRNIAFLEGRYAAPFNGFICGAEQDPYYSVWGYFGNNAPEWGHGQPEKCRQILDVLMPGANTHPLRQKFEKRRFFFSGTPYGDFDEVPAEAEAGYLSKYKLLLNLGWNTMIAEDYAKLKKFAENGGTLLTGIPQFSTHTGRGFLRDFEDLALWNNGDISDLCGIIAKGRGGVFSGQWNCAGRENIPEPELSALPNDSPDEDGPGYLAEVELRGAETAAWDAANGKPMLVRRRMGKGWIYTLTLWAYPGHERFQKFAAAWVAFLASASRTEIKVEDPSKEVFWTLWERNDATKTLMMLNTDWTKPGNIKTVRLATPRISQQLEIKEHNAVFVDISGKDEIIKVRSEDLK